MIPEQRLREIAEKRMSPYAARHFTKSAMAAELLAARAAAESARRDGQEIAAGLHEKLHELRAENERLAKQMADLRTWAEKWSKDEERESYERRGVWRLVARQIDMLTEQPKPTGGGA